jgi:hypothetical protein
MFKKLLASMGIGTVKVNDADWNGSLNIQKLGQLINLPGDPSTLFLFIAGYCSQGC